jgi:hypothetical protein
VLERKIKYLSEAAWEHRIDMTDVKRWLSQFERSNELLEDEQLHALFLLSEFIYFGQAEIRELLKSVYRDLFRSRMIYKIRRENGDTRDRKKIDELYSETRKRTRFLGVGNPSESGTHLLYYFRQENGLPKNLFINSHEIFQRRKIGGHPEQIVRDTSIENYVYIDDLCGSGTQAISYMRDIVEPLKAQHPNVKVFYFVLFATSEGLRVVRELGGFDAVDAIFELDHTFRSLEPTSRVFENEQYPFVRTAVRPTCEKYGKILCPAHPLGYKDGQLVLGFSHNTPDNTLPIFWADSSMGAAWTPIFRRFSKDYGW